MDKLKQFEAFIAVVEHGSMAAAALTQNVTPVMIGRRINALEARIGVKLLHRTTRRISVTNDGAAYYERCVRILADVEEAEQSLTRQNNSPRGTLSVDTTAGLAQLVLVPHLHEFFQAYPDLK
ncbi:LysR family transcriptional regulator, partial [Pseudomonas sp. GW460-13]|uniref:LysR family transcriptional regulator n=1 Tax=Pseudomonas sp. GW460-13 TaxID=2070590 RepID=UPI000CB64393